ncbi:MAG: type II toxin-antitoxin system RelE/ParE family toxin [Elusimicrobia bacterium]|nr:type II toxin-antitoxin system RelE/ParE family toxin [Elusimicrobiota bacterium]
MARQVILLPQAQKDLDEIYDPLFSKIIERLELLREFPDLGVPLGGPFLGYHSTVVEFFRIIYKVTIYGHIEVAYVRHCSRRPPEAR